MGGAVCTAGASVTKFLRDVTLSLNKCGVDGGGIYNRGYTKVWQEAYFEENHARVRLILTYVFVREFWLIRSIYLKLAD